MIHYGKRGDNNHLSARGKYNLRETEHDDKNKNLKYIPSFLQKKLCTIAFITSIINGCTYKTENCVVQNLFMNYMINLNKINKKTYSKSENLL